jgi:CRISPR system Cascade subunit CasC
MFIELHVIQNFAPSNLNRDDTNNPKDCEFGGVRRARISSQCVKRAIRFDPRFAEHTGVPVSHRTKLMVNELVRILAKAGKNADEARPRAEEFAKQYSSKKGNLDKNSKTVVMLFLSQAELDEIAVKLQENWNDMEAIKKLAEDFAKNNKNRPGAPDIALFGRMLADRPETNVDAACQVAHAISTHRVNMDIDFFTAVDDLLPGEETGAGMMGVSGFNSACFYRYAVIDFGQLVANLNGDVPLARKTVEGFLYAAALAVPTGKQNSSAAQNPPSFLMAVVRQDGQCWSLANAFEKPAGATAQKSLIENSVAALDQYWGKLNGFYGGQAVPVVACLEGEDGLDHLKDACVRSMPVWVEAVTRQLPQE